MNIYEIYLITNIVNSKKYIGLSTRGGKFRYFAHPNCSKPIKLKVVNCENNQILVFESILECIKTLNIPRSTINYCIKNEKLYKKKLKFEKERV